MLPADTGAFIQINDLAIWRQSLANDPVVRQMLKAMPHHRKQKAWDSVLQTMDMSGEQVIDRYFGKRIVFVARKPGWRQPMAMMLQVTPDDTQLLIKRLGLQPVKTTDSCRMLATPDGSTRFVIRRNWLGIARSAHETCLRATMNHDAVGQSLAQDPRYRRWVSRLPASRSVLAFFRDSSGKHTAAAAIVDNSRTLSIHYVGRPPGIDSFFQKLGSASALELGPMPGDALAVIMLNVYDRQPGDTGFINRILAPKTYEDDILPRVRAPLVLFLGQVPSDQIDPEPGAAFPVVGLAIRLHDPTVAEDLTLLADNALMVANITGYDQDVPSITFVRGEYRKVTYRKAHAGAMLVKRTGRKELAPLTLTYGRIGNWYVVCTHDWFFRQCIDADADPKRRLTANAAFAAMPLSDVRDPVMTAMLRGPAAAAHLRTWVRYWQAADRDNAMQDMTTHAAGLVEVLDGYQSLTAQFYKTEDRALAGRLDLVRR